MLAFCEGQKAARGSGPAFGAFDTRGASRRSGRCRDVERPGRFRRAARRRTWNVTLESKKAADRAIVASNAATGSRAARQGEDVAQQDAFRKYMESLRQRAEERERQQAREEALATGIGIGIGQSLLADAPEPIRARAMAAAERCRADP